MLSRRSKRSRRSKESAQYLVIRISDSATFIRTFESTLVDSMGQIFSVELGMAVHEAGKRFGISSDVVEITYETVT